MMNARRRTLFALSTLALSTTRLSTAVRAQTKVVRFILPVATASGVDTITRAASPALSAALGYPVVVENQPGAGGIVGTQAMGDAVVAALRSLGYTTAEAHGALGRVPRDADLSVEDRVVAALRELAEP